MVLLDSSCLSENASISIAHIQLLPVVIYTRNGHFGLNFPTIEDLQSRAGFLEFGYTVLRRTHEDIFVGQSSFQCHSYLELLHSNKDHLAFPGKGTNLGIP